jgi:hypothetical protein
MFFFFNSPGGVSDSRTIQDNVQWQGFDHHHQRDRLKNFNEKLKQNLS